MTKQSDAGIVLPMLPEHIKRVLDEHKDILPKFVSRIPNKPESSRLKAGMKVVFYVSHSGRRLAGEAEISSLEFLIPKDAVVKYGNRLMLSHSELDTYVSRQPARSGKPMLVLNLKNVRSYPDGVAYPRNVSMTGEYFTAETYDQIRSKIKHP